MNTQPYWLTFLISLAVTVASAILGKILESSGAVGEPGARAIVAVKLFFLFLFCLMAFSLVPLLLNAFIAGQVKIGNADLPVIKWLQGHEQAVVYGVWLFFLLGLGMAIPAAIKGGFFSAK